MNGSTRPPEGFHQSGAGSAVGVLSGEKCIEMVVWFEPLVVRLLHHLLTYRRAGAFAKER